MKFVMTSHAIERWQELADPLLSWSEAKEESEQALTTRPERCGTTPSGQAVFRVEAPRLAFLVVKLGPDKLAKAYRSGTPAGIIVTVLPQDLWQRADIREVDEIEEAMQVAREEVPAAPLARGGTACRPAPPRPNLRDYPGRWEDWAWAVATIERDIRIAEADRAQRARVDELGRIYSAAKRLLDGAGTMEALRRAVEAYDAT
jgi:hypothetical protein